MAFLCPVRIRRGKKKKSGLTSDLDKEVLRGTNVNGPVPGMGRITGSASIETLVRVGIEKENGLSPDSKMVVLHDFTPCVDDELTVKRGQVVNILYRENDWVYVIAEDSRQEGFIPHSYCTPYNSQLGEIALNNVKKKLPRAPAATPTETVIEVEINEQLKHGTCGDLSDCESFGNKTQDQKNQNKQNINSSRASLLSASSHPEIRPFFKDPAGRYIVLYTFIARDENDVSVERGEFVTVLNREDPDWYWIIRSDGQEGFVPSGFVYPADIIQGHVNQMNNNQCASTTNTGLPPVTRARPRKNSCVADDDPAIHGTEMVMLYDYKPQAPDDLSVKRGEWIYADLDNQMVEGWLWTYAPKTRKYGFIPKAYAHPPAMTSLNVNKCENWKKMSVFVADLVGRSTVDDIDKVETKSNLLTLLIRAASGVIGRSTNVLKILIVNGLVLLTQTILKVSEYGTAGNKLKFAPNGRPIDWILNNSYIKSMMGDAIDETLSDRLDQLAFGMPCVQLLMCRLSPIVRSMQRQLKEDWMQHGKYKRAVWNVSDWLQVKETTKRCAEKQYDCVKLVNPTKYSDRD